ncbi:MAG: hypothetical protein P8J37_19125 [Fuerstiella sp.]|nr:hypothetical protein [Fuerstiella sp.]
MESVCRAAAGNGHHAMVAVSTTAIATESDAGTDGRLFNVPMFLNQD